MNKYYDKNKKEVATDYNLFESLEIVNFNFTLNIPHV